ncbi:hypothetical protein DBR42_27885, partial [Pelomonas sp. HMWF004]
MAQAGALPGAQHAGGSAPRWRHLAACDAARGRGDAGQQPAGGHAQAGRRRSLDAAGQLHSRLGRVRACGARGLPAEARLQPARQGAGHGRSRGSGPEPGAGAPAPAYQPGPVGPGPAPWCLPNLMPWTFAHPAAVLPLRRVPGLSVAGLVLGSLSPDFGYYLGLFGFATWAHDWWGVAVICLPACWLVHMFWLRAWRPLAALLPSRQRTAWLARSPTPVTALAFSVSAVLGAATHAVWDAFTHRGGFLVRHLALLREPLALGWPVQQWLQHASTLVGLVALGLVYRRWLPAAGPGNSDEMRRRCELAALALLALLAAWAAAGAPWRAHFHFIIVATDVFLVAALALAFWRARRAPHLRIRP